MAKYTNGSEIPVGLGIALEKNNAMDYFFSLPQDEQQRIIDRTHTIRSKNEMLAFVQSLMGQNDFTIQSLIEDFIFGKS